MDRLGGAPLRERRRPAAGPAAQADPLGLHDAEPEEGGPARAAYDDLEARIERLRSAEQLASIRPDLDGNQIMAILGIPAGPDVGRAWQFLKDLRLDRGPLPPEVAQEELLRWWAARNQERG